MTRLALAGLGFPVVATLPAASSNSGVILQGPNGILFFSNGTIWIPLNQQFPSSAISASSGSIVSSETYVSAPFQIPANSLAVKMVFRIKAYGVATSSSAKSATFNVRMGTGGTISDTLLLALAATSATTGTSIPFEFEALVTIQALTSSGKAVASARLINNGITGISAVSTVVAGAGVQATINTTVAQFVGLSYVSAASGASVIFNQVTVEQVE
jgi:hypothetical protein